MNFLCFLHKPVTVLCFALLMLTANEVAAEDATPSSLEGKNVAVFLAVSPVSIDFYVIEALIGSVIGVDDVGVRVQCKERDLIERGKRKTEQYQVEVFVPWSSILYIKLLEN